MHIITILWLVVEAVACTGLPDKPGSLLLSFLMIRHQHTWTGLPADPCVFNWIHDTQAINETPHCHSTFPFERNNLPFQISRAAQDRRRTEANALIFVMIR
jgi:hypothetical protein